MQMNIVTYWNAIHFMEWTADFTGAEKEIWHDD